MSVQSDAAKAYIEKLLDAVYCTCQCGSFNTGRKEMCLDMNCTRIIASWEKEYRFAPPRRWAFDYAIPAILCANPRPPINGAFDIVSPTTRGVIEIDGGTFQSQRTGHSSGVGLRAWREKNNAAMTMGWRVWHYAPEEIIQAGRKRKMMRGTSSGIAVKLPVKPVHASCVTLPDEPILLKLPWM